MKRLRDDGSSSQSGSLSGHLDRQSQVSASGLGDTSRELTIDDGKTFLKEVEETFQDQREKYYKFLKVLIDFKHRRTNVPGVIPIVKELFEGHDNLISGINIFLPKGSEIALDNDEAHPRELFNEARSFVTKIKMKLLFYSVEFQLQMLAPSILMMTFVPTGTLSK
ncbi:hypothetical protein SO802_001262 [Lithocarpus litseifolius]|uniref:Uncharacterized protein n=1 Tax=Lithocarpus litseifolius TaxID=425828 RepID=A0AAW2DU74_9ROSI